MLITLKQLRTLINESLKDQRSKEKMYHSKSGIRLTRVGGLSPVKQVGNKRAPEKRGVWAFIWPYVEPYLLGSTNDNGIATEKDRATGNTRYHQMKREGLRHFVHRGVLYTQLPVPGSTIVNGWFKTTAGELNSYLSKYYSSSIKSMRQTYKKYGSKKLAPRNLSVFSKDDFEVFVPKPGEEKY